MFILKKSKGSYSIVKHVNAHNVSSDAFNAQEIKFVQPTGNSDLIVTTEDQIDYINGPKQTWTDYYKLMNDNIYWSFRLTKQNIVSDHQGNPKDYQPTFDY